MNSPPLAIGWLLDLIICRYLVHVAVLPDKGRCIEAACLTLPIICTSKRHTCFVNKNRDEDGKLMSRAALWKALGAELRQRTIDPVEYPSFVFYFILAVVIAGGAGIWLELILYFVHEPQGPLVTEPPDTLKPVVTAVITFFSALAGSAAMQIIWAEDKNLPLRAYAMFVLIGMLIIALLIGLLPTITTGSALFYGAIATLFSLWTWWIANAKQRELLGINPENAVGGDPQAQLAGTLDGFTQ
jgi:hypothetical protein